MNARAEIERLIEETARLFRACQIARGTRAPVDEQARLRRQHVAACRKLARAQRAAVQEFAGSRGWCIGKPPRINRDFPVIDHVEVLQRPGQKKPALLTHSYAPTQHIAAWAAQRDYRVEVLPWSWWAPGIARACVLIPRSSGSGDAP